ncbi:MAG TPA: patatin-like phospholipase family protein [bacterium]|nr:patatin-like phospholipase family protein [bacterium]HNZ73305.1 patatin-like phospholipase family protein [bacterium]HOH67418.1 patatin-like phospholipase family protein [bacterium]HPN81279.1 patatin-like phospholipase family protein [bacterium]HPW39741.1 patatin-like phospholipase family protein [bacterium]
MTELKRPKIGLALGSGGSRGLAHIGVIKALEENNIPIDFVAGSSIGTMVGGFYAAGLSIKEIEKIALSTTWRRVFSVLFDPHLKQGLIGGEKLKTFIEDYINGKKFEDCKIPFVAVATDLKTGEVVVLNKGEMAQAIRASVSIPLVFKPVKINGRILADGGLSAPVPVEIARNMGADIVIAVNLDKHYCDEERETGWYDIANDSLNILRHHLALSNVANADIVIEINVGKNYWYQFTNGQNKILTGEKATKEVLPKLKEMVYQKSKGGLKKYLEFFKR